MANAKDNKDLEMYISSDDVYESVHNYVCSYMVPDFDDYKESALWRITHDLIEDVKNMRSNEYLDSVLHNNTQYPKVIEDIGASAFLNAVSGKHNVLEFLKAVKNDTGVLVKCAETECIKCHGEWKSLCKCDCECSSCEGKGYIMPESDKDVLENESDKSDNESNDTSEKVCSNEPENNTKDLDENTRKKT